MAPTGLLHHSSCTSCSVKGLTNLRVSEIWESEAAWQQAWDGGLKAALSMAGVDLPEPDKFPVHELWGSRVADG